LDMGVELSDQKITSIKSVIKNLTGPDVRFMNMATKMHTRATFNYVYPEHKFEFTPDQIQQIINSIDESKNSAEWFNVCDLMSSMTLIDPDYKPELSDSDWDELKRYLGEYEKDEVKEPYLYFAFDLYQIAQRCKKESVLDQTHALPETRKF
jgi:hypothetical protein